MYKEYNEKMLYERYPALCVCREKTDKILNMMADTYKSGGKILLCGNGGSCADCDHIVGELMKSFMCKRSPDENLKQKLELEFAEDAKKAFGFLQKGVPAINLCSQTAILTAYINDVDPDFVYAQLVYGYAKENDMLLCLSTSGNSKNVVNAAKMARVLGIKTCAITGQKENMLSQICDVCVCVPETETYKVQELTLPVYHHLCAMLEIKLFGEE